MSREERLEEALLRIQQWAKAYPVEVFRPVSDDQLVQAGALLKCHLNIDMGALHAGWARHILDGITAITEEALNKRDRH